MNEKTFDELMAMLPKHSKVFSVPTICRCWGKSRNTVITWIKKGYLRAVVFPADVSNRSQYSITRQALEEFLKKYIKATKI